MAGLATAIQVYKRCLAELEPKLKAIQLTSGKSALEKEKKEIYRVISVAEAEVTEIQVLISKLRSEARIDLK